MNDTKFMNQLQEKAGQVASLLSELSNANRLLALCHIADAGEIAVGRLAAAVGVSQSALSQHLARLRDAALVETRKDAQTVYYRLADERILSLLITLRDQFCPELGAEPKTGETR